MPCFVYVIAFSIRDAINNLNIYSDFWVFSFNFFKINIKQVKIHFENKEIINDAKKKMNKKNKKHTMYKKMMKEVKKQDNQYLRQ